jgi:hypothetical protein
MLTSVVFCVMLALPMAAAQYIIDPPTTAPEDTIRDCTNWWIATESDTCESLAEAGFISLEQLYDYVCLFDLLTLTYCRILLANLNESPIHTNLCTC